jgi:hypothetical protein
MVMVMVMVMVMAYEWDAQHRLFIVWLNRDPIGERGGINLYGMCGNDAVNRWDILGRLSPDRIAERGYCPLKVGFWVENGDGSQNNLFKSIAQKNSDQLSKGSWRAFAGNSASSIIEKLMEETGRGKSGTCVKTLTIAGHGWSGVYLNGPNKGKPAPRGRGLPGVAGGSGLYMDASNPFLNAGAGGRTLADIRAAKTNGQIIFCAKCVIQIHACWVDSSFISALAQATGCQVIGAMGGCSGSPFQWRSGANENPNETHDNKGNGFYQANPDGTGSNLGNDYLPPQ